MSGAAMNWAELPYYLAVARKGSLRSAADSLGATHATVDRHLKSLEASFSVRLFDRTRTGLALTEAGEALVPLAEEAEMAVIAARRRLSGLDREAAKCRPSPRRSMPRPSGSGRFAIRPAIAHQNCRRKMGPGLSP